MSCNKNKIFKVYTAKKRAVNLSLSLTSPETFWCKGNTKIFFTIKLNPSRGSTRNLHELGRGN